MQLNNEEIRRYSRHLILPEVGLAGQKKIKATSVLCIGAGGLGSPIAMYLAAAGAGRLGLVDFDTVDFSNLQRQIIHGTEDVGRPKSESARETIRSINPNVEVTLHGVRLSSENAMAIISQYDIVVDGTDNFPTRYLTNDACVLLKKPNVYGSIFRFEGKGTSLINRLLLFNALDMKFREVKLRRDPKCPLCGDQPTIHELIDYDQFCGIPAEPVNTGAHPDEVTVQDMKKAMTDTALNIKVLDVREPDEYQIARVEGARLVPLSTLPQKFTELDPNQQYYLHCKAGVRSMKALLFLREQGFKYLKSVKGGISAWSDEIDHNVPKY